MVEQEFQLISFYRGCAARSDGHLSQQLYELKSYYDGYEIIKYFLSIKLPWRKSRINRLRLDIGERL